MRSPLKLKFWRSPLISQVSNAIAPQVEILAIAPHPTSFSAIAPQVEILAIAPHPHKFQCDRPSLPQVSNAIAPQTAILAIAPRSHKFQCDRPSDWVLVIGDRAI